MPMELNDVDYFSDEFPEGDQFESERTVIEEESYRQPLPDRFEFEEEDSLDDSMEEDEDILTSYLKTKGINPDSIKFQNEEGEIEEVSFNSLSREEQLQLLENEGLDDNYGLDDQEVSLINYLRANNMSVQEYQNYIAQTAVKQYLNSQQDTSAFQVDTISDDELFILDLKTRIPEVSDAEALEELENAKSNTNLYNRKIKSIRDEYKEREEAILKEEQAKQQAEQQEELARFESVIVEAIQNNSYFDMGDSALELSVDDKNELASFILDSDAAGVRYIAKALNDPSTLVKMAWYALKGEEAFSQISDYYKQEIAKAAKTNYQKGYEDAKSGKASAKAVVKKPIKANKKALTINDIDL